MINRFGTAIEPVMRKRVAQSLVNKGLTLDQLNRLKKAIHTFDEVLNLYDDTDELAILKLVDQARNLRKSTL
jgi:hypothetical protein